VYSRAYHRSKTNGKENKQIPAYTSVSAICERGCRTEKTFGAQFDNHDEVFSIIEKIKEKDPFSNQEQAAEFALGLKLFSEVMIKNRNHPLFEELTPAFGSFMKRLKSL
jgi:hypothetical protein